MFNVMNLVAISYKLTKCADSLYGSYTMYWSELFPLLCSKLLNKMNISLHSINMILYNTYVQFIKYPKTPFNFIHLFLT